MITVGYIVEYQGQNEKLYWNNDSMTYMAGMENATIFDTETELFSSRVTSGTPTPVYVKAA